MPAFAQKGAWTLLRRRRCCIGFTFSNVVRATSVVSISTPVRGVSLSELAKAFTEMSEEAATHTPVTKRKQGTCSTSNSFAIQEESNPNSSLRGGNDDAIHNNNNNNNSKSDGTSAMGVNMTTHTHSSRTENGTREIRYKEAMNFSAAYADSLRDMTELQLSTELDAARRRHRDGNILQCLLEVWRRLRAWSPMEHLISDAEADGEFQSGINTSNEVEDMSFRSDRLLEAVLRLLTRTHLDVNPIPPVYHNMEDTSCGENWVTELSMLLMQWLCARVALLNAAQSATFLHLLAQQKILHCESVLETLRDNIEVGLREDTALSTHAISTTGSVAVTPHGLHGALDVNGYSVLLDSFARWQLGVARLLALDTHSATSTQRMEWHLQRSCHPILNVEFYETVVSSLLRDVRRGFVNLTQRCSPTTFFFLTLALAKIRWFHKECAMVLLPQLHEALRVFPAQFLGVVLLLGRREVRVCDVATTDLLLQTLLDAMQKRGQRYKASVQTASIEERQKSRLNTSALTAISAVESNVYTLHKDTNTANVVQEGVEKEKEAVAVAKEKKEEWDTREDTAKRSNADHPQPQPLHRGVDNDGDDVDGEDLLLFSDTDLTQEAKSQSVRKTSPPVLTTSLLDLRTTPVFLESLHHILSLTFEKCVGAGQTDQSIALEAKATILFEVILRDTHSGVKSIRTLLECPGLAERLLQAFLRLPLAPNVRQHPLLVELAYVFTRHIGRRRQQLEQRLAMKQERNGNVFLWQRRAVAVADQLVEHGILLPESYLMSERVIQSAPRVAAAVEAERMRLQGKRERQHQIGRDEMVREGKRREVWSERVLQSSAVFTSFARVVRHTRQQLRCHSEGNGTRHTHSHWTSPVQYGKVK